MIILFALIFALLIEVSVTTLPLVLLLILFISLIKKKSDTIPIAFVSGLVLDILTLKPLGFSSLFFVGMIFLSSLYERKFEIQAPLFVFIFSFVASFIYLFLSSTAYLLLLAALSSLIALFSFLIYKMTNVRTQSYRNG